MTLAKDGSRKAGFVITCTPIPHLPFYPYIYDSPGIKESRKRIFVIKLDFSEFAVIFQR